MTETTPGRAGTAATCWTCNTPLTEDDNTEYALLNPGVAVEVHQRCVLPPAEETRRD